MRHFLWHLLHPRTPCEPPEPEITEINDMVLTRHLLYDSFDDPERIAQLAGLPPISPDLAELEMRDHKQRLEAIKPVMPLLLGQAEFMGATSAAIQCMDAEGVTPEHLAVLAEVFITVIKASVIASVSTAVSMGVLEVSKEVVPHVE